MFIQQWLEQLEYREKRILLLGALLLTVILVYFLAISPLIDKKQQLDNIIMEQQATLQWMYSAANEIQRLNSLSIKSTPKNTTLTLIDNQADILGNVNKRIEPVGESVQISFEAVSFSALIQWLANLHQQQIQATTMTLDALPTPDKVKARMILQQGYSAN